MFQVYTYFLPQILQRPLIFKLTELIFFLQNSRQVLQLDINENDFYGQFFQPNSRFWRFQGKITDFCTGNPTLNLTHPGGILKIVRFQKFFAGVFLYGKEQV